MCKTTASLFSICCFFFKAAKKPRSPLVLPSFGREALALNNKTGLTIGDYYANSKPRGPVESRIQALPGFHPSSSRGCRAHARLGGGDLKEEALAAGLVICVKMPAGSDAGPTRSFSNGVCCVAELVPACGDFLHLYWGQIAKPERGYLNSFCLWMHVTPLGD